MNSFTIAIATNDDIHIADSHFGDAAFFLSYSVSENAITQTGKKENSFQNAEENHNSTEKMNMILSLIDNADILVSRKPSPNFLKIAEKSTKQPVIVDCDNIDEILNTIKSRFSIIHENIKRKLNNVDSGILYINR
jgi:predicted Fe-Mo cluster-binding NifX family protein